MPPKERFSDLHKAGLEPLRVPHYGGPASASESGGCNSASTLQRGTTDADLRPLFSSVAAIADWLTANERQG